MVGALQIGGGSLGSLRNRVGWSSESLRSNAGSPQDH